MNVSSRKIDMNGLCIPSKEGRSPPISDPSCYDEAVVETHFRRLEEALCKFISRSEVVVGCVAWLTNRSVLQRLAGVDCQIVVQKEDFLRPDAWAKNSSWRNELHALYSRIKFPLTRYELPDWVNSLSCGSDPSVDGVRCAGEKCGRGDIVRPRMHHKFLVSCTYTKENVENDSAVTFWEESRRLQAVSVWTGSYNFTENGSNSLENAVVIHSPAIANAYLSEWANVLALSEPLNWDSEYIQPEWEIGT